MVELLIHPYSDTRTSTLVKYGDRMTGTVGEQSTYDPKFEGSTPVNVDPRVQS